MTYNVPIDRTTVRVNPTGGNTVYRRFCGTTETCVTVNGEVFHFYGDKHVPFVKELLQEGKAFSMQQTTPIETLKSLSPEPYFLFGYQDIDVSCEGCGETFCRTELKSDDDDWGEGYAHSDTVCPRCGMWHCCNLVYETLDNTELAAIAEANK